MRFEDVVIADVDLSASRVYLDRALEDVAFAHFNQVQEQRVHLWRVVRALDVIAHLRLASLCHPMSLESPNNNNFNEIRPK